MQLPMFVINLDRDIERIDRMRLVAARQGLSFVRIPAVAGLEVPERFHDLFLNQDGRPISGLLPGEVGCYASHLVAAEQILRSEVPRALVCEDDVEFANDVAITLDAVVRRLPENWDIVRLSNPPKHATLSVDTVLPDRHLVRYSSIPKNSASYLLSASGARKLLAPVPRVRPIDADLRYAWQLGLDTYGVVPAPVRHAKRPNASMVPYGVPRRLVRGHRWPKPTLGSRLRGAGYMMSALGGAGWLACAARNIAIYLKLSTARPIAARHRIWAAEA